MPLNTRRQTLIEDVHALLIGSSFIAVGLTLLKAGGLVTGGVAGVAPSMVIIANRRPGRYAGCWRRVLPRA